MPTTTKQVPNTSPIYVVGLAQLPHFVALMYVPANDKAKDINAIIPLTTIQKDFKRLSKSIILSFSNKLTITLPEDINGVEKGVYQSEFFNSWQELTSKLIFQKKLNLSKI